MLALTAVSAAPHVLLAEDGRLDVQVELQCSWRQPGPAIDALLNRRIGGKAVLHID